MTTRSESQTDEGLEGDCWSLSYRVYSLADLDKRAEVSRAEDSQRAATCDDVLPLNPSLFGGGSFGNVGVRLAWGAGSVLLFLATALVLADLTDDLKPSHNARAEIANVRTAAVLVAEADETPPTPATLSRPAPSPVFTSANGFVSSVTPPRRPKANGAKRPPVEIFLP